MLKKTDTGFTITYTPPDTDATIPQESKTAFILGAAIDWPFANTEKFHRDNTVNAINSLVGLHPKALSSKDPEMRTMIHKMEDIFPSTFPGVKRWFLPICPEVGPGRFVVYITHLKSSEELTSQTPDHVKSELKIVVSGEIYQGDKRYCAGDWFWFPRGNKYTLKVGKMGCTLLTEWPHSTLPELANIPMANGPICSRDEKACSFSISSSLKAHLHSDSHFLPIAPEITVTPDQKTVGRYFKWISRIEPNSNIPSHGHSLEKAVDFKVVISGSITFQDHELCTGDWFAIPSGLPYTFRSGPLGATLMSGWPHN